MSQELAPGFLVAAPQLTEPSFARTVVLLIEHDDEEGSLGLVINREARVPLEAVLSSLRVPLDRPVDVARHPPVLYGGPVSTEQGFLLHSDDWLGARSKNVTPGLALSADIESIEAIALDRGPARYRLCLGYAGWGPGQLYDELRQGSWITVPFDLALVFETPLERLWEVALGRLGIHPGLLVPTIGDA